MAVTATDFYPYAKETGTQIPGSKKEEAELVPVINRWKKNRLSIPRTESKEQYIERNEPNAGTLAGLAGIGALALAGFKRKELGQLARNLGDKIDTTSTNIGSIKKDLNTTPQTETWEDKKQKLFNRLKKEDKSPETNEPYVNESRRDERSESYRLKEGRKQADSNLASFTPEEIQETVLKESQGEIPPGMQTPEQKAVVNKQDFVNQALLKVEKDAKAQAAAGEYTKAELNALRGIDQERKNLVNPRSYIESTGAVQKTEPKKSIYITETVEKDIGPEHFMPGTNMSWDDVHFNAGIGKYAPTKTGGMKRAPDGTLYDPTTGMTQDDIAFNAGWASKYEQPTLVEKKQNATPLIAEQAEEAIDTGFDQVVQRIDTAEQRDIDSVSLGKQNIESGSINPEVSKVASSPINQNTVNAATNAQEFLNNERLEIASQLGEQNLPITSGRVEKELSNRLGPNAYKYGPDYTKVKQDLQIGATYDPAILTNPNLESVKVSGGYEVPVTDLKQPTVMRETALRRDERKAKEKDWLGNVRLDAVSNMRGLEQEAKNIKAAQLMASTKGDQRTVNQLELKLNQLRGSYQKQQRRIKGATKSSNERISKIKLPLRLKPGIEEGQRVFAELDATGQPIPGTQEIRSERIMIDTPTKGGGGRKVADYSGGGITSEAVREIQTGGLISTPQRTRQTTGRYRDYDIESGGAPQGFYKDDSLLSGSKKDMYGTRAIDIDPKTGKDLLRDNPEKRPTAVAPSNKPLDLKREATPESKRAMEASEEIRKIYSSGRPDAQELVKAYRANLQKRMGI